jgi:hypothetical protein
MGRIRSLRPEGVRSLQLAEVSPAERWTLAGLWCFVDDEGRIEDNARIIKAEVYPYDDITVAEVEEQLAHFASADLICRYEDPSGRFLHVIGFTGDQKELPFAQRPNKPTPSTRPGCGREHSVNGQGVLPYSDGSRGPARGGSSGSTTGGLPEVSGSTPPEEKRREEKRSRREGGPAARFDEFWSTYPRKAAKPKAEEAWAKAITKADPDLILAAAASYRDRPGRTAEFTAHPTTWLNQERWADEDADPGPPRQRDEGGTGTGTVAPYRDF